MREQRHGGAAADINFRDKAKGWRESSTSIRFASGKIYRKRNVFDPFFQGFVNCMFHNSSCYACEHNTRRSADLTFSDYWHFAPADMAVDEEKGVSLVIGNGRKGKRLLERFTRPYFCGHEIPLNEALTKENSGATSKRERILADRFRHAAAQIGPSKALRKFVGVSAVGIVWKKLRRMGVRKFIMRIQKRFR